MDPQSQNPLVQKLMSMFGGQQAPAPAPAISANPWETPMAGISPPPMQPPAMPPTPAPAMGAGQAPGVMGGGQSGAVLDALQQAMRKRALNAQFATAGYQRPAQ